jgi:hypothetical protein
MPSPPILSFAADQVGTDTTEYTPTCIVSLIAFGIGNPETDGHCWVFSRSFDDDDGVCTVREIQLAVVYEGIQFVRLTRSEFTCVFQQPAAKELGFSELHVAFVTDAEQ